MDALVLIGVFDLTATVGDVDVHPAKDVALGLGERIAQTAERNREITGGIGRSVEVLMKHLVGRREDDAMVPIHPHEVLCDVVPEQRIAVTRHSKDVKVRSMAMRLLV